MAKTIFRITKTTEHVCTTLNARNSDKTWTEKQQGETNVDF